MATIKVKQIKSKIGAPLVRKVHHLVNVID